MSEIFWESTQKARKEHFCDWCCNWIQPGELYMRKIWAPRGRRSFHVIREHDTPHCPPNFGEEMAKEMMRAERAELGVPIVLVVRQRAVLKIAVDGTTIIQYEPEVVPTLVCEVAQPEPDNDGYGEEIPF